MDVPKEVDELKDDLVWTRYYLNQYKKLFLHNKKRTDLLNITAPGFFRMIQLMFWDEMIVSVARLMDPHIQRTNKNLSLGILLKLAQEHEWNFTDELNDLIDRAKKKAEPVITRRMKLTAHRDLPTAMGEVELDKFGIEEIEIILDLAGQALNLIYLNVTGGTWSWNLVTGHDADELIHYLKLAVIYEDLTEKEQSWLKDAELQRNSEYYTA
jgi:hypothetical protein